MNTYNRKLEIVKHLEEIKKDPNYTEQDFLAMVGSCITYDTPYTKKQMMQHITNRNFNMLDSFSMALYALFNKADNGNVGRLTLAFPFHGTAFKLYGKENADYLRQKLQEV